MGLGVLRSRVMEHVPGMLHLFHIPSPTSHFSSPLHINPNFAFSGTTRYYDDPDRPQIAQSEQLGRLKCDTSGPQSIILVPQPSDDLNDPLVWESFLWDDMEEAFRQYGEFGVAKRRPK